MTGAIILAAGKSRRMGTQKLLLPVDGVPLIVHVASEVLQSSVDRVFAVISPGESVADVLAGISARIEIVTNPDSDGDMLSSIRCGIRALPLECDQFLLVLGDQPGITAGLIENLLATQRQTGKSIVAPFAEGRRGHPILIGMRHREEILTQLDGTGLRGLLANHADEVAVVPVEDPRALQDIDLPEDYSRLTAPGC